MSSNDIGAAVVVLSLVFAAAALIRRHSSPLRALFIPTAVIGGFLALALGPEGIGGIRRGSSTDPMQQFRLIRAGIGISTGLIVVINRFPDFTSLNSVRVVVGIGLLGIGIVSLVGIIVLMDNVQINMSAIGAALLLAVWGAASLYQARSDTSSSRLIGWAALIIGGALIGLALLRRQRSMSPAESDSYRHWIRNEGRGKTFGPSFRAALQRYGFGSNPNSASVA